MKEVRYTELQDIETRDENLEISGYAIVFGQTSKTLGGASGFKEIIHRSALNGVDLDNTHLYYQHNADQMLANTKSGTMNLNITDKGLYFRAEMADTQLGIDTYKLIKRGDLSAMSFGFTVKKDTWNVRTTPEVRTVTQIDSLSEISIVSRPAYEQSYVNTRSEQFLNECRECRLSETDKEQKQQSLSDEAKQLLDEVN